MRDEAGREGCCVASVGHLESAEQCAAPEGLPVLVAEAGMMCYVYTDLLLALRKTRI